MSTLHKDHRDVLIAPVVSEKCYGLLDANKYTFIVHPDAAPPREWWYRSGSSAAAGCCRA